MHLEVTPLTPPVSAPVRDTFILPDVLLTIVLSYLTDKEIDEFEMMGTDYKRLVNKFKQQYIVNLTGQLKFANTWMRNIQSVFPPQSTHCKMLQRILDENQEIPTDYKAIKERMGKLKENLIPFFNRDGKKIKKIIEDGIPPFAKNLLLLGKDYPYDLAARAVDLNEPEIALTYLEIGVNRNDSPEKTVAYLLSLDKFEDVFRYFGKVIKLENGCYSKILTMIVDYICDLKDHDRRKALLKIEQLNFSENLFGRTVKGLIAQEDWEEAFEHFDRDCFMGWIVDSCMNQGQFVKAAEFFNKSHSPYKNVYFCLVIKAYMKLGQWEKVYEAIEQIKNNNRNLKSCLLIVSNSLLKLGKKEEAIAFAKKYGYSTFEKDVEKEVQLKKVEENIQKGNYTDAQDLLNKMSLNINLNEFNKFTVLESDDSNINLIQFRLLVAMNKIKAALIFAQKQNFYNGESAIEILLEKGLFAQADVLLQKFVDYPFRRHLFIQRSNCLISIGKVDEAIKVACSISDVNCKTTVLMHLVEALLKINNVVDARKAAEELIRPRAKMKALEKIAKYQAQATVVPPKEIVKAKSLNPFMWLALKVKQFVIQLFEILHQWVRNANAWLTTKITPVIKRIIPTRITGRFG